MESQKATPVCNHYCHHGDQVPELLDPPKLPRPSLATTGPRVSGCDVAGGTADCRCPLPLTRRLLKCPSRCGSSPISDVSTATKDLFPRAILVSILVAIRAPDGNRLHIERG